MIKRHVVGLGFFKKTELESFVKVIHSNKKSVIQSLKKSDIDPNPHGQKDTNECTDN